jgi:hypothetical protein
MFFNHWGFEPYPNNWTTMVCLTENKYNHRKTQKNPKQLNSINQFNQFNQLS